MTRLEGWGDLASRFIMGIAGVMIINILFLSLLVIMIMACRGSKHTFIVSYAAYHASPIFQVDYRRLVAVKELNSIH